MKIPVAILHNKKSAPVSFVSYKLHALRSICETGMLIIMVTFHDSTVKCWDGATQTPYVLVRGMKKD